MSRPLLATALRSLAAQRRRHDFERWIGRAEEELGEPLSAESEPLSSAMCAACEAGWEQHALAMNASLADAGRAPSTAALNALMAMRLDASADGDDEQRQRGATSALDVFIRMRVSRVPPPDRDSAALATAAAGRRKETWSGLRNLLRRPWLRSMSTSKQTILLCCTCYCSFLPLLLLYLPPLGTDVVLAEAAALRGLA